MPDLLPGASGASGAAAAPAGPASPPIKGFLETSFLDWKGKISAVVFLPGCNFACPYCHNHVLVHEPDSLLTLSREDVLGRLRPFVGWVDGVVVSGGEPTLHPGLPHLLEAIKDAGFAVKLDTNGYRPEVLASLHRRSLVDMAAMDLKAPLEPLAYRRAAGRAVDVGQVRASLDFLRDSGLDHELRSTIWPAWHGPEELAAMARDARGVQTWTLQAMSPTNAWNPEALGRGPAYDPEELQRLQAELADPVCRGRAT